jgi:GTPase
MKRLLTATSGPKEKAILVQVILDRQRREDAEESLKELARLADTAGAVVTGNVTQRRERPTSNYFIGEGKLADIQLACRQTGAKLVIFNNELSPIQVNNIDLALGIKVIDRTEVILQIFARRARSAESQIQVELAQLEYLISRIPVSEKQSRFSGGIGMKGPGESPLSLHRAPMRKRIKELKDKLEKVQAHRDRTTKRRSLPLVSLVGYTNAGKSSLLNKLTHSDDAYVDDRLFATLDTRTRVVYLDASHQIMLTDTVGFIRDLPHGLVASFKSTLDVARESDLLVIVLDASEEGLPERMDVVYSTLEQIGASKVPAIVALNKCDLPGAEKTVPALQARFAGAIPVSAVTGQGLAELKGAVSNAVSGCYTNRESGRYQ